MRLFGAPASLRSCLDRGRSPTTDVELDDMRRRVWHEQGVAVLPIEAIQDPWLRQAITNEATRLWGRRTGGTEHGR